MKPSSPSRLTRAADNTKTLRANVGRPRVRGNVLARLCPLRRGTRLAAFAVATALAAAMFAAGSPAAAIKSVLLSARPDAGGAPAKSSSPVRASAALRRAATAPPLQDPGEPSAQRPGPSVATDKSDYSPGEAATINGAGFHPNEVVTLQVTHDDDTAEGGAGHDPWAVQTDAEGKFTTTWYVNPDDSKGSLFLLKADCPDGLHAEMLFTDASATFVVNLSDSGWYSSTTGHSSSNKNYFVGTNGSPSIILRDYFVFDLSGINGTVTGVTLRANSPCSNGSPHTYFLYDVTTPVATLEANNPAGTNIWGDLGSGTLLGSSFITTPSASTVTVNFNSAGLGAVQNSLGHQFAVGGDYPNSASSDFILGCSNGGPNSSQVQLVVSTSTGNSAPTASPQAVTTNEDTPVGITLSASDPDGNALTYSVVAGPAHGSLSGAAPNLTYSPNHDFNGADSFTFKANDGQADSNVATVTITVDPVNDPPSITAPGNVTAEATGPGGAVISYPPATATDVEDVLTPACSPAPGSLFPLGTTTVTCSVTDTGGLTASAAFRVTVQDTTPPSISNLPGAAQAFDWVNVTTNGAPSARGGHGMVYDPVRHKTILFGGSNSSGFLNDVWEFDAATRTWTNVTPSGGDMPIPRAYFAMAYDEARNKVVIYGGNVSAQYSNVGITGDTWEWDPATHTWAQKPASSLRFVGLVGSAAAYDPVLHRVVLFGGHPYWQFDDNGMWAWDGSNWVELSPATRPAGRAFHNLATDRARNRIVLFGGYNGNLLGDTWEWDGSNWQQVAVGGPAPGNRDVVGLAYDAGRSVTVLFGGSPGAGDTWQWDGTAWKLMHPQASPSARPTSMVYDSSQSRLVIFSGGGQADTWFSQPSYSLTVEAAGPDGAPVSWSAPTAADAVDGSVPVNCAPASGSTFPLGTTTVQCTAADAYGNTGHASFTVTVRDTTPPVISSRPNVTAEATGAGGGPVTYTPPTATDAVDGGVTVNCSPASGSTFPFGTTQVNCSAADAAGNTSTGGFTVTVQDTTPPVISNLPGSAQSFDWVKVNTSGPAPRVGHQMVYDSARNKVILFGGQTTQGAYLGGQNLDGQLLNDMWEWDGVTKTWSQVTPAGGPVPPARSFFGMAYDPSRHKVVIYGGKVGAIYYSTSGDTWEWDPATRAWASFPNADTIVYGGLREARLAYDPNLQQVILFGGIAYYGTHNGATFAWTGNNWALKSSSGPSARVGHAMATDFARSRVVLFGGYDYTGNNYAGLFDPDTWEWDGTQWNRHAAAGPGVRVGVSMAYDANTQTTFMFGGNSNDTWEWNGTSWTLRATQDSPSARYTALAFDGTTALLFGGSPYYETLNDTWLLQPSSSVTAEATGPNGAPVSWPSPTATDAADGSVPVTCAPASGSTFPLGTTNVQCTATDSRGNTGHASFTVTVQDTTPPTLQCPAPVTVEGNAQGGATGVSVPAATATDLASAATVSGSAATSFPLGTTQLNYSARDAAGNTSSCSSSVTVVDTTTPALNLPADVTAAADSSGTATLTYAAAASDVVAGAITPVCDHPSGSAFAVGFTTVKCTATDQSGNTSAGSFKVTVFSNTCAAIPSGAVAWYPGEGSASDIVGANDGSPLGGLAFAAGEDGQAFSFNGTNAGVKIPAAPSLNVGAGSGLTVELWVNPANLNERSMVEWNNNAGGIGLHFNSSVVSQGAAPGNLYSNLIDTGGNSHIIQSSGGFLHTNQWQHAALTYDRTTGVAVIYLNGVAIGGPTNIGVFTPQTGYDLYLADRPSGSEPRGFFGGQLDEVRVYNRALSAQEVQSLYFADGRGACQPPATNTAVQNVSATFSPNDQSVTLNASVTSPSGTVGDGTVLFTVRTGGGSLVGSPVTANVSNGTAGAAFTLPGGTRVQTLNVTATYTSSVPDFQTSTGAGALDVTKRTPAVTWADPADITYGTALSAAQLNAAADVPGTFAYTPAAGSVLGAGDAQTLSVTFTPADPADYDAAAKTVSINVNRAALTVKTDDASKTYGDPAVTFTAGYTGLAGGDTPASLGGALTFDFTDTPATGAGTYSVTPGGLSSANYAISYASGTFKVSRAALVVTAADAERFYGEANPAFAGTLDGVRNGDAISATYSTSATQASGAGVYPVVPALSDPSNKLGNYDVTANNGKLTVKKTLLTVTADDKQKTYGQENPPFTASFAGFVLGEGPGSLEGSLSFSTQATAGSDVGPYAVTPGGLSSSNYAIKFVAGTLNVGKAALAVTANDASKLLGAPNPAFTARYEGFVLGQNESALGGALTFTTAATQSSPVGSYAVTPGGLTSPNYAITFKSGALTVGYNVCVLFDQTKSAKSGSTIPVKLQLCDANGADKSSPSVVVQATGVAMVSTQAPQALDDSGDANPDMNFRYDATLGPTGGYVFNLSTKGYPVGTFILNFNAAGDSTPHAVQFSVK